jgi:flagellar biosynthesis/type III secretory pathway M-ring protein FliF/YscJ
VYLTVNYDLQQFQIALVVDESVATSNIVPFDNTNSIDCTPPTRDNAYIGVIVVGCALAIILIIAPILYFRHINRQKNAKASAPAEESNLQGAEEPVVPAGEVLRQTTPFRKRSWLPVSPRGSVSPWGNSAMSQRDSDAGTVFSQAKSNIAQLADDKPNVAQLSDDISPVTSATPGELDGLPK